MPGLPPCFTRRKFQSALPLRGATISSPGFASRVRFQSALPLRGATTAADAGVYVLLISTRAPLAGSDAPYSAPAHRRLHFNPRSPGGERRPEPVSPSIRTGHLYQRSPCGERRPGRQGNAKPYPISIRAPLAGSDSALSFSSSLPWISIRAPLAGSDRGRATARRCTGDFNPRSPCGERLFACANPPKTRFISIRAPLAGSDNHTLDNYNVSAGFQSALPLRGATG